MYLLNHGESTTLNEMPHMTMSMNKALSHCVCCLSVGAQCIPYGCLAKLAACYMTQFTLL